MGVLGSDTVRQCWPPSVVMIMIPSTVRTSPDLVRTWAAWGVVVDTTDVPPAQQVVAVAQDIAVTVRPPGADAVVSPIPAPGTHRAPPSLVVRTPWMEWGSRGVSVMAMQCRGSAHDAAPIGSEVGGTIDDLQVTPASVL